MFRGVLLPVHVTAGGAAILLGATALIVRKGAWLHRRAGLLFVVSMLAMGISGSTLALAKSWTDSNTLGGFMTAYFVVTALTTVRPSTAWTRGLEKAALLVALGLASVEIALGLRALSSPHGTINGVPFFMLFFLATITLLAAAGDVRVMWAGALRGTARLRRHLWRMCFALFIAAASFFSIRARVARIFPEPLTTGPVRALPILLIFVAMFYWLWRVRRRAVLPAGAPTA